MKPLSFTRPAGHLERSAAVLRWTASGGSVVASRSAFGLLRNT
jgi:hypothetical protein